MRQIKHEPQAGRLTSEQVADNFADLHPPLSPTQARVEAERCLYCYEAPCITACPTAIDIPTFIHQIRSGNLTGAGETILSANIMGGTCARACPTEVLCEEACVVNKSEGAPVKIGQLQRRAVDHVMATAATHPFKRVPATGKKLAVVGAGPAGLSFAHKAAMLGHDVTVYDAKPKPGGLNEYGLAAYKMVEDFARREVDFLLGIGGIEICYHHVLGRDIHLADLTRDYEAVFLGLGLARAVRPDWPGTDLDGVEDALSFIARLRQTKDLSTMDPGRHVVVVGGGNTAIDAAVQSKALGAQTVTILYRRGPDQMGATAWEQDLAKSAGITIRYWSVPLAFKGEIRVQKVDVARTQMLEGTLAVTQDSDILWADRVLLALGQVMADDGLDGLDREQGRLRVDDHYRTSHPKIYAGGDCIARGADLTVQAVEDGKQAALAVNAMLKGDT